MKKNLFNAGSALLIYSLAFGKDWYGIINDERPIKIVLAMRARDIAQQDSARRVEEAFWRSQRKTE